MTQRIHLLFTDVVLPAGMNGADLAAEAQRLRPDLRVLFTTGHDRNALADLRLETGVQILNKPFLHSDLAVRVREALSVSITADQTR